MKNRIILIIIFLMNSLLYSRIPDWVKTHQSKKYPASHYIIGIGIGNTQQEAIENARADLLKQITVKIKSITEASAEESQQDKTIVSKSTILNYVKTEAEQTLPDVKIAEIKKDKNNYYALAVLNREKYLSTLKIQIYDIIANFEDLKENANNNLSKGNLLFYLGEYKKISDLIPELLSKSQIFSALTGTEIARTDEYSHEKIDTEIKNSISCVKINLISNLQNDLLPGKSTSQPLIFKLVYQKESYSTGLKNIPFVVKYATGETIGKIITDENGVGKINFIPFPTEKDNLTGKILILIDVENLQDFAMKYLKNIRASVIYKIKIPDITFRLKIINDIYDTSTIIENLISRELGKYNIKVTPSSPYEIISEINITQDKEISSPLNKLHYTEVNINLKLLDNNGNKISSLNLKSNGVDKERKQAIINAINNININSKEFLKFISAVF